MPEKGNLMDTYQVIDFIRIRHDEVKFDAWNSCFRIKTDELLDEKKLYRKFRLCVKQFLKTDAGKKAVKETTNYFTWLDAIDSIPHDFWVRYSIHRVASSDIPFQCCGSTALLVYLDEVLCDDALDPDDKRCLCSTCTHRITERNGEPVLDCSEAFAGVSEIADDGAVVLVCDDYESNTEIPS